MYTNALFRHHIGEFKGGVVGKCFQHQPFLCYNLLEFFSALTELITFLDHSGTITHEL